MKLMKEEQDNYMDGKLHMLRFTPHIKVFHLKKLLVRFYGNGLPLTFFVSKQTFWLMLKPSSVIWKQSSLSYAIRDLTQKTQRQRQRERQQTKALMSRTMAMHVHFNSWYISLPSSAKPQCEMTKLCVVWRT